MGGGGELMKKLLIFLKYFRESLMMMIFLKSLSSFLDCFH